MLQWICGHIRKDHVQNDDIHKKLEVAPVEEKLMQHRLRWFGHIKRRPPEAAVCSRVISQTGNEKRGKGRPNFIWEEFEDRFEGLEYHQGVNIR
jgi:hypothetical protein